jgi:transcriptional regulator of heat shock response
LNSATKTDSKQISIDPRILEEKLNLYENILKKKMDNANINLELKVMRESINELIENRKKKLDIYLILLGKLMRI